MTCVLFHELGHETRNTLKGPPDNSGNKNPLQAIESTVTSLQRYTLKAALGIAAGNDDDANGSFKPETISDDQLTELRKIMTDTGASESKFCRYYKIEKIEDLPANQFDAARAALWTAGEQRKKKAQANG